MKALTTLVGAAAIFAALPATADTEDVPAYVWLRIEPGSRPGGFGKSFTGLADDVNASYYNPGGLALQETNGITVMHEARGVGDLKDIFYDYAAFAYRVGKYGTFCFDMIYHDAGNTEMTDGLGRVIGSMHSYMAAPSVYWSYPVRHDLGLGAGLTYAYEDLANVPGGANDQLLFNGGVLYRTPLKGLSGGLALVKFGRKEEGKWINEDRELVDATWASPGTARLGLAYNVLATELNDVTLAGDVSKLLMNLDDPAEDEFSQAVYSGGVEYVYAKMVAVRAGYYRDKWAPIKGMTLGFGFNYKGISFDYSRVPEGEAFRERHRFAVGYQF